MPEMNFIMAMREPEPEPEPSAHNLSTDCSGQNFDDGRDTIGLPEPLPDFSDVTKSWNIAFPIYTYSLGTAFLLLTFYAFHSSLMIIYLSSRGELSKRRKTLRPFIFAVNIQVLLLGICRAATLLIDPYNIDHTFPPLFFDILFNIPFPCLSSALGLLNWVVLQVSKLKLTKSSKISSIAFLLTVILSHYAVVLTVCFVTHLVATVQVFVIICQGFFVVWGLVLCIGFFIGAAKIYRLESSVHEVLHQNTLMYPTPKTKRKLLGRTVTLSSSASPGSTPPPSPYMKRKSSPGSSTMASTVSPSLSPLSMRKLQEFSSPASPTMPRKVREWQTTSTRKMNESDMSFTASPPSSPRLSKNNRGSKQTYSIRSDIPKPVNITMAMVVTNLSLTIIRGDSTWRRETQSTWGEQTGQDDSRGTTGFFVDKMRKISSNSTTSSLHVRKSDIIYQQRSRRATTKVLRISTASAILGLAASGLNIYGMLCVYVDSITLGRDGNRPELWAWYIYQLLFRLIELAMGMTMAYFTTEPSLHRR